MDTYICAKCGEELDLDDVENWDELACSECDEPIPEENVPRALNCKQPGPHGCGKCEGCLGWGEYEHDRKIDRMLEREG